MTADQLSALAREIIAGCEWRLEPATDALLGEIDPKGLWRALLGDAEAARVTKNFLREIAEAMRRQESPDAARVRQGCIDAHPPIAARPPANPPAVSNSVLLASRTTTARSVLDTLIVNGRPIRNVTATEALEWGEKRHGEARLARALATGVPPNGLIGDYISDEEATARAKMAEASNA